MQLERKSLAFGQLPATKGDLYVPDNWRKGYVQNIIFHNTNTSAEEVVLNYHDGSSEHPILKQTLAANDSFVLDLAGEGDVVQNGGKYTGNADTADKVTYKFSGTDEILSGATAGVPSNLWHPPTTPHAEDDEFEGTALSGWTGVKNITDGVVGSFSYGAVDAYDTTFNSGNVVRVNVNEAVRRSWANVQVPATNKLYSIYKAITIPTNLLVVARMKFNMRPAMGDNDSTLTLELVEATAGEPAYNSRIYLCLNESDATTHAQSQVQNSGGSFGSATNTTNVAAQGQALEYMATHKIGTTFHTWVGTAGGNWIHMATYSGLDFTPDMVALGFTNNNVSTPGVKICGVDFVRFFETDSFLL